MNFYFMDCNVFFNDIVLTDEEANCPEKDHLCYSFRDKKYIDIIERNYSFASKRLLELLVKEKDLMARLRYVVSSL